MMPNTFEGAVLMGKFDWLAYTAGYLTAIKPRHADDFISMAKHAGAADADDGLALVGFRLAPWKPFWIEVSTAYGVDPFNTAFVQAEYRHALAEEVFFVLGAQYTDQRSVGDELVASFDT